VLVHPQKTKPDARSKFGKALDKHAVVMESKPIYENQAPGWVEKAVQEKGYQIAPDAAALMAQGLGTNLARIAQELDKVYLHLQLNGEQQITKELVYDYVAIDRRFNSFELVNALAEAQIDAAFHIGYQLARNLRDSPLIPLLSQLHQFFLQVAAVQQARLQDAGAIARDLKMNRFAAERVARAARKWSSARVMNAQQAVAEADLAVKGVSGSRMPESHVLLNLLGRILRPVN
jgi:DNA polymerase III, delta subunit